MKKSLIFIFSFLVLSLTGCRLSQSDVIYSDDVPFSIEMENDSLKILQLTDLHLTYGIDDFDRKTFACIETLVKSDDFDLVVITGDMTMSISAPSLFAKLVKVMESLETPWTFVFGNHETDYNEYVEFLKKIENSEYLYYKNGPELDEGGLGNFMIEFTKGGNPFYKLYFLDSHAERAVYTEEEGEYDYLKISQVDWYEENVAEDLTDSVMFMHIPLRQFIDPEVYVGLFNEDKVYAQGVDTGMFDKIVEYGLTRGVFVGHDHLNNFYLMMNDVLLAYGQITGYNAYGNLDRGGRVIEITSDGELASYILLESEVSS